MREDWRAVGAKKTLWRRIRDMFDDTVIPSSNRLFTRAKNIEDYCAEPVNIIIPEVVPAGDTISITYEAPAETMLPVPVRNIPVPAPRINFERKEVVIPIKILSFKISKNRKIININLPRIKMNLTKLKRLLYLTGSIAAIAVIFFAAFVAQRIVDITDGDFMNNLIRYKMGQEIEAQVAPVAARVDNMKATVDMLEANRVPIVNYVVKQKVQKVRIVNGKVVSVQEYER